MTLYRHLICVLPFPIKGNNKKNTLLSPPSLSQLFPARRGLRDPLLTVGAVCNIGGEDG